MNSSHVEGTHVKESLTAAGDDRSGPCDGLTGPVPAASPGPGAVTRPNGSSGTRQCSENRQRPYAIYSQWNVTVSSSEGHGKRVRELFAGCVAFTVAAIIFSVIFALMSTLLSLILPGFAAPIFAIGLSLAGGIIALRRAWQYLKKELDGM